MHRKGNPRRRSSGRNPRRYADRAASPDLILSHLPENLKDDAIMICAEDSKFSRYLRKFLQDDLPVSLKRRLEDLKRYLEHSDNVHYVMQLQLPALNVLFQTMLKSSKAPIKIAVAKCLSSIGAIMFNEDDSLFIDWIIEKYEEVSTSLEKELLMNALHQSLQSCKDFSCLRDRITKRFQRVKKFLEESKSSTLMISICDNLFKLSAAFPEETDDFFEDIIDIVVGWFLEPFASPNVVDYTLEMFNSSHDFWIRKMDFTQQLLLDFLNDCDTLINEFCDHSEDDNEKCDVVSCLSKMFALLKIFKVILSSIQFDIPFDAVCSMLSKLVEMMVGFPDIQHKSTFLSYGNECVSLLVGAKGGVDECVLQLMRLEFEFPFPETSFDFCTTVIRLCKTIAEALAFDSFVIDNILSLSSCLWKFKFSESKEVVLESLSFFKWLILSNNILVLETVYRGIISEIQYAYSVLLNESYSLKIENAVELELTNEWSQKEAEICVLFNFNLLSEIGKHSKNNLILMHAFSPSVFDLFLLLLEPTKDLLINVHPSLMFGLIKTMFVYCTSHAHFISTSELVCTEESSLVSVRSDVYTSGYFSKILCALTNLLSENVLPYDVRLLLLSWFCNVVESMYSHNICDFNYVKSVVDLVIERAYDDEDTGLLCSKILAKLLDSFNVTDRSFLMRIRNLAKFFIMSTSESLRDSYLTLLFLLPLNIIIRSYGESSQPEDELPMQIFSDFCCKADDFIIGSTDFSNIMLFVLCGENQNTSPERSFRFCEVRTSKLRSGDNESLIVLRKNVQSHTAIMWLWSLWESSLYCVNNKLKTLLGKSSDTLLSFEESLQNLYKNQIDEEKEWWIGHLRRTLLLLFFEFLDKNMYNAYEGTSVSLPAFKPSVISFFQTNKTTCVEWLSRIRFNISEGALKNGNYEIIVRNMWRNMKAMPITHPDFESCVILLAKAYIRLKSADSLRGLHRWLEKLAERRFDWLKPSINHAAGSYEEAVDLYKLVLTSALTINESAGTISNENKMSHQAVSFVYQQINECYFYLFDWPDFKSWIIYSKKLVSMIEMDDKPFREAFNLQFDISVINALSNFDAFDLDGCKSCIRDFQYNLSNCIFEDLSPSVTPRCDIDRINVICSMEMLLAASSRRNKLWSMDALERIMTEILRNFCIDPYSQCNSDFIVLKQIAHFFKKEEGRYPFLQEDALNPLKDRSYIWNFLISMMSKSHLFAGKDANLDNIKVAAIRLARKQGNSLLAVRLLNSPPFNHPLMIIENCKVCHVKNLFTAIEDMLTYAVDSFAPSEQSARNILNVVKWVNTYPKSSDFVFTMLPLLAYLEEERTVMFDDTDAEKMLDEHIGHKDVLVKYLMQYAIVISPEFIKAHYVFASWCCRQTQKYVNEFNFSTKWEKIVPTNLPTKTTVLKSLNDISVDKKCYNFASETYYRSLISKACPDLESSIVEEMVSKCMKKYNKFLRLTANACFNYLNLVPQKMVDSAQKFYATFGVLSLMKMLEISPNFLGSFFQEKLGLCPAHVWAPFIPQLFSMLSNSNSNIRQIAVFLIDKLSEVYPHLIIYPALAAGTPESEKCLEKLDSGTVSSTRVFIQELRRITLLWEELWLGTLSQLSADAHRLCSHLSDIVKQNMNSFTSEKEQETFVLNKKSTLLKPVISILEQVMKITDGQAESVSEKSFQDEFGDSIKRAFDKLRSPNTFTFFQCWSGFREIHRILQKKSQKRQSYSLDDISQRLTLFKNTSIPLPSSSCDSECLMLTSIDSDVHVLGTKTKPKRLTLHASDGSARPFLLKGLEDIRLDERIMQFLSVVNTLFYKLNRFHRPLFRCRSYSVVPLGPKSGLIQLVEPSTSIFTLYKNWQRRKLFKSNFDAQIKQQKTDEEDDVGNNEEQSFIDKPFYCRPYDIYRKKLATLVSDKNLLTLSSKALPTILKKKCLSELIAETPSDLLEKELWCSSLTPGNWWHMVQHFNRSAAVMSITGYIIGLGDRHLENLLIDFNTGELIHIDYNVCFDKGKSLRIAETVPFRLTQNIVGALGLTGVEGLFRESCHDTLRIIRENSVMLMNLLETSIFDTSIELRAKDSSCLTSYNGGVSMSKQASPSHDSEYESAREICLSRISQVRNSWIKMRGVFEEKISKIYAFVEEYFEFNDRDSERGLHIKKLEKVRQYMVAFVENSEEHPLHTLCSRNNAYKDILHRSSIVLNDIDENCSFLNEVQQKFQTCCRIVSETGLRKIRNEFSSSPFVVESSSNCIRDFLNQTQMDKELCENDELCAKLNKALKEKRQTSSSVIEHISRLSELFKLMKPEVFSQLNLDLLLKILTSCKDAIRSCQDLKTSVSLEEIDGLSPPVSPVDIVAKIDEQISTYEKRLESERQRLTNNDDAGCLDESKGFLNDITDAHAASCAILPFLLDIYNGSVAMESFCLNMASDLHQVRSKDGDWFLEEFLTTLACALDFSTKITTLFPDKENPCFLVSFKCIQKLFELFSSLKNLYFAFITDILPKLLMYSRGDSSRLKDMKNRAAPLLSTSATLYNEQFKSPLKAFLQFCNDIAGDYVLLLNSAKSKDDNFSCIIVALDALFTAVENHFVDVQNEFLQLITSLPHNWRLFEFFQKNFVVTSLHDTAYTLDQKVLFLNKIGTIAACIENAEKYSECCATLSAHLLPDDKDFLQPIQQCIADCVLRLAVGYPSLAILCFIGSFTDCQTDFSFHPASLHSQYVNELIESNEMSVVALGTAAASVQKYYDMWKTADLNRRVTANLSLMERIISLKRAQRFSFSFLYMSKMDSKHDICVHEYKEIINKLRKVKNSLLHDGFDSVVEAISNVEKKLMKKVRWVAGCDPDKNNVAETLVQAEVNRSSVISTERDFRHRLSFDVTAIIDFETLRSRLRSTEYHRKIVNDLYIRTESLLKEFNDPASKINAIEACILENKEFKAMTSFDSNSVSNFVNYISEEIINLRRTNDDKEDEERHLNTKHKSLCANFKTTLDAYRRIAADIQTQVGFLTKAYPSSDFIKRFLQTLHHFKDRCSELLTMLNDINTFLSDRSSLRNAIDEFKTLISKTFDSFDQFAADVDSGQTVTSVDDFPSQLWMSLKERIEGVTPVSNNYLSVLEQVNTVINEATSLDNLAVMYEGWTAWV